MGRIEDKFFQLRSEQRAGLIAFLPVGFPTLQATPQVVKAMVAGGADIVELGIPFSDPLADGATIQRADHVALSQGVTAKTCLNLSRALRSQGLQAPLVLMGYYNPILAMGVESFCQEAVHAGVDGVIVVDLPPEEADELLAACRASGLALIFLLAPTSTPERIKKVAERSSGFIYCVSLTGITGARNTLPLGLPEFIARVRKSTDVPLAVGFGISTREHVEEIGEYCDAAVVGSALVQVIEAASPENWETRAREYLEYLSGKRLPESAKTP